MHLFYHSYYSKSHINYIQERANYCDIDHVLLSCQFTWVRKSLSCARGPKKGKRDIFDQINKKFNLSYLVV